MSDIVEELKKLDSTESAVRAVKKQTKKHKVLLANALAALIIAALGFVGGVAFQKHKSEGAESGTTDMGILNSGGMNSQAGPSTRAFGGFSRRGAFGTVASVSATSISINDARAGTTNAYTITSATTVTNNGAAAKVADVKVGDTVLVRPSTTNTTEAMQISVNPTMPTGGFRTQAPAAQ